MDYNLRMHRLAKIVLSTGFAAILPVFASASMGEVGGEAPKDVSIRVATRDAPPFSFKGPNGNWMGISIEAWEHVAKKLGYTSHYREYDLVGALDAVERGNADIGVAAFSITAARAKQMYFTHSYASAGLGIATTRTTRHLWGAFLDHLLRWDFLRSVSIVVGVMVLVGALIWLFERKENHQHFSRHPVFGLGSGFWWSAVTMTTVGYGDKAPVTLGGRAIGLLWMFFSIIIISGLTGSIAAALTLVQIVPKVNGPQDLPDSVVGTIKESAADEYLTAQGIHPTYFENIESGLRAVEEKSVAAFVADHAILSYWVARDFAGRVEVLRQAFDPTYLALPMPLDAPNHNEVDIALLEFIETPAWGAILTKYSVLR